MTSPTPNQTPNPGEETTQRGAPRSPRKKHRPSILGYLILLFTAAFFLLLLSYFMQQRRSDQSVIDGLQQNASAMETVNTLIQQNQQLQEELDQAREDLDTATENQALLNEAIQDYRVQAGRSEETIRALDYLWRIEREYFRGSYTNARNLIKEFEEAGLTGALPDEALVDPDYRTPAQQYQAIYDSLY